MTELKIPAEIMAASLYELVRFRPDDDRAEDGCERILAAALPILARMMLEPSSRDSGTIVYAYETEGFSSLEEIVLDCHAAMVKSFFKDVFNFEPSATAAGGSKNKAR